VSTQLEHKVANIIKLKAMFVFVTLLYYRLTWAKYELARPYVSASPGTRRATKLWRRSITVGGPGSRAVPTRHRACAPLRPRTPVAIN